MYTCIYSYVGVRGGGCPNGVFFSWARLEGARLRIPVSVATRPDRAFRPPRFRTENCRFGAVGFGPPEAVLGLPRAIWGSRTRFGTFWRARRASGHFDPRVSALKTADLVPSVLGLPKPFWGSRGRFGARRARGDAAEAILGLPRAIWGSTCSRRCGSWKKASACLRRCGILMSARAGARAPLTPIRFCGVYCIYIYI